MCWQAVLTIAGIAGAPFTGGASMALPDVAQGVGVAKSVKDLFAEPPKTTPEVSAPGPLFPNPDDFTTFLRQQGAVGASPFSAGWPSGGFGGE